MVRVVAAATIKVNVVNATTATKQRINVRGSQRAVGEPAELGLSRCFVMLFIGLNNLLEQALRVYANSCGEEKDEQNDQEKRNFDSELRTTLSQLMNVCWLVFPGRNCGKPIVD